MMVGEVGELYRLTKNMEGHVEDKSANKQTTPANLHESSSIWHTKTEAQGTMVRQSRSLNTQEQEDDTTRSRSRVQYII